MAILEREALRSFNQLYMAAESKEEVKRKYGVDHLIKLSANENRLGYSPKVNELIAAFIKNPEEQGFYPDLRVTVLSEKVAKKLDIKKEQLIFGNGSFELISFIGQSFLEPGDEAIASVPSFHWYNNVTLMAGATPIELPLKDYAVDLDAIEAAITKKTKIIWICNPNNPTGTKLEKERLYQFLECVPKNILVVLDEAYIEFVEDEDYVKSEDLIKKYDNIIALRTFSKMYGLAGFRIGYGFANEKIIASLNKTKVPINVSAISQIAAIASIDDEEFPKRVRENAFKSLKLYYDALDELGLAYIRSNTNFILFDTGIDSLVVAEEYLKHGIAIRPGVGFGYPTWVRVTIGTYEDNVEVIEILRELKKK